MQGDGESYSRVPLPRPKRSDHSGLRLISVFARTSLSMAGMVAAALGYLTPVEGSLLEEVIDVAVA